MFSDYFLLPREILVHPTFTHRRLGVVWLWKFLVIFLQMSDSSANLKRRCLLLSFLLFDSQLWPKKVKSGTQRHLKMVKVSLRVVKCAVKIAHTGDTLECWEKSWGSFVRSLPQVICFRPLACGRVPRETLQLGLGCASLTSLFLNV